MMRYAVIDIGSSSVKFLAVAVRTVWGEERIQVLNEQSRTTRLAENLLHTCELSPDAIERTISALQALCETARELKVTHFRAVATSAVRDSKNRKEFLHQAKNALGFPVRLLSGEEEAETVFFGVTADPYWKKRDLLAFDIGGGSTEWIQGAQGKVQKRLSLPLGCVRLRERFIQKYPLGEEQGNRLLDGVRAQVQAGIADFTLEKRQLVGTGGTMSCLASMHKKLEEYDAKKIDHTSLTLAQVQDLFQHLKTLGLDELKLFPGLPARRADIILPGIAVVLATMETLGARRIKVSIRGLRYGVLYQFMAETHLQAKAAHQTSVRSRTVKK